MTHTYRHNPRPTKGPVSFALDGNRLTVDTGRKVQELSLEGVEQVRLTYQARSFAQNAFQTRIRMKDGRSITFSSMNWKSLTAAERLDREYRIFTRALFDAIGHASPGARFVAGQPRPVWILTVLIAILTLMGIAVVVWRALQAGATSAALMGGVFALVGIWQIEPMVRLNRPRRFTPEDPPKDLMP